ncbi:MAG: endolytic transglycosylase MltG [Gemmatimonadaceae bacterium]
MRRRPHSAGLLLAFTLAACGRNEAPAPVTIPTGATMRAASESLHRAGVVGSPNAFRLYARLRGSDRGIKPGMYVLNRGASWETVLSSLRDGRGLVHPVTVPEGFTLAQIEVLLVSRLSVPADSVRAAVTDSTLLRRLNVPIATAEGYLFPDTYLFPPGTSARAAVAAMVRRFEQAWRPEWTARLDTLARSRHELLTLASIVEREARLPAERPVIAAVYWNRLGRRMLLQADPTVQYALPQYQSRLMHRHLEVASPYNTYKHPGLPPGPIGAPGAASIEATLYPASVPYLYFVGFPDGHHEFRVRLEEHQAAARLARRQWNALRAQQRRTPIPVTPPR